LPRSGNGHRKLIKWINRARRIIGLLEKAAHTTKEDCDRAFEMAHKLSLKPREAEDRTTQLQSQVELLRERALKAENWMVRIYKEVEGRGAAAQTRPARLNYPEPRTAYPRSLA
jgi:hypothetical protein